MTLGEFEAKVLRVGTVLTLEVADDDSKDRIQLEVLQEGGTALRCTGDGWGTLQLEFTEEAMASAEGLLGLAQANPHGCVGDPQRDPERRRFTFAHTSPPFLLSRALAGRVAAHAPIRLHYFHKPLDLAYGSTVPRRRDTGAVVVYRNNLGALLAVAEGARVVYQIRTPLDRAHSLLLSVRSKRGR